MLKTIAPIVGSVKSYSDENKFGYILGEDDHEYFFELMLCVNKSEDFKVGDTVSFIPKFSDNVYYASEVKKSN